MNILVKTLEEKGMISDDDGPWGAMSILASKPNQDHVAWHEYLFRFCVSYRKLNAITRPFIFPTRRCDDAVESIRGRWKIQLDMDAGYWQVALSEAAKAKTAFFVPDGKKKWEVLPMGCLNAHPFFCRMMECFKKEWDIIANELGLKSIGSTIIVDDICLFGTTVSELLRYFKCVLQVLQKYRATLKLKKSRFLPDTCEFSGVGLVGNDGRVPAPSKNDAFQELDPPDTFSDLRMLIGTFGFYQNWIPLFEL